MGEESCSWQAERGESSVQLVNPHAAYPTSQAHFSQREKRNELTYTGKKNTLFTAAGRGGSELGRKGMRAWPAHIGEFNKLLAHHTVCARVQSASATEGEGGGEAGRAAACQVSQGRRGA